MLQIRVCMPQLKIPHAATKAWHNQINKKYILKRRIKLRYKRTTIKMLKLEEAIWLRKMWGKIRESWACLNSNKKNIHGSGSQMSLHMRITWRAFKNYRASLYVGVKGIWKDLCAVNLKLFLKILLKEIQCTGSTLDEWNQSLGMGQSSNSFFKAPKWFWCIEKSSTSHTLVTIKLPSFCWNTDWWVPTPEFVIR